MYGIKILDRNSTDTVLSQSTWLVTETMRFAELQICERAVLKAPEGKILTLVVNGVGREIRPGTYRGEVILAVTEPYHMEPHGLMRFNQISRDMHCAAVVDSGRVVSEKCLPEIIRGGTLDGKALRNARIASSEECFNGLVITGDTEYAVENVKMDLEGFGDNDFLGVGAGVTAIDNSRVTIDGCTFDVSGVTRCAIHAGGDSQVTVKNSRILNMSPDTDWLGSFTWQLGVRGSNRLTQLTDNANVVYENCDLFSNGWGICSIDGTEESCRMVIRDSRLTLTGPRANGYGAFCIGENEVVFERCRVDVEGYPLMLMGMEGLGKATICDSDVKSGRFGVFVVSDDNSGLNIHGSRLDSVSSSLCIKGSSTIIHIDDTEMTPGNGTLVQLMDTEESGMDAGGYHVPVGVSDRPVEGRELSAVSPTEDVTVNIGGCTLCGNIYNSTTNIRAYRQSEKVGMGRFHDTVVGILQLPAAPPEGASDMPPEGPDGGQDGMEMLSPVMKRHHGDDLRGPKNLGVTLRDSKITGVISSAVQAYRDGVTYIDESTREELSNVTQTAAPTVNNGVCVFLLGGSEWTVTDTSYITALTIEEGAAVRAAEGKRLTMTVDGVPTPVEPGRYQGRIVLSVL